MSARSPHLNANGSANGQLNPLRFKTALKMAISKLKFVQDKKTALAKQQRRQLADLLNQGKESSATIRVENIIRDDIYVELLELLELYCELLLARHAMILDPARTTVDPSLKEAVSSVIYSAPHSDLKEVSGVKDFLVFRYGPEFAKSAIDNAEDDVPHKIVSRCVVDPPPESLVVLYLSEIAKTYQVPYSKLPPEETIAKHSDDEDDGNDEEKISAEEKPASATEPIGAHGVDPPQNKTSSTKTSDNNDFDALKARFAALKGN